MSTQSVRGQLEDVKITDYIAERSRKSQSAKVECDSLHKLPSVSPRCYTETGCDTSTTTSCDTVVDIDSNTDDVPSINRAKIDADTDGQYVQSRVQWDASFLPRVEVRVPVTVPR